MTEIFWRIIDANEGGVVERVGGNEGGDAFLPSGCAAGSLGTECRCSENS